MNSRSLFSFAVLLVALLLLSTPFGAAMQQEYSPINFYELDEELLALMETNHLPSISYGVIKHDELVVNHSLGYSNKLLRIEADENTAYMIASISKTFTSTAIMQLYEQDYFDLDDDINEYLPSPLRNPNYPDTPITFRMLLTHQSSLDQHDYYLFFIHSILNRPIEKLINSLNRSTNFWTDSKPGESVYYSSVGMEVLGYLVQCISGQSYPDYCKDHIFLPLEMYNSSFHPDDYSDSSRLAMPYCYLLGLYFPMGHFEDQNYASGGLRSTVFDLSHYLIAFMNCGVYKDVRILQNETVEEMLSLQVFPVESNERMPGYGLGWQIFFNGHGDDQSAERVGHNGGMPGAITYMFIHVRENVGVILLSNQHTTYTREELTGWMDIIDLISELGSDL